MFSSSNNNDYLIQKVSETFLSNGLVCLDFSCLDVRIICIPSKDGSAYRLIIIMMRAQ